MSDQDTPWLQQPGEPSRWFARFHRYLLAGPNRSMLATYKAEQEAAGKGRVILRIPGAWTRAVEVWQWHTRALAWDARQRQQAEESWQERQEALRQREWAVADQLMERAEKMLQFPLTEAQVKESADGKVTITIVTPARWKMADAAEIARTASALARLASGMPTEKVQTQVTGALQVTQRAVPTREQLEQMSDEELARLQQELLTPPTP